LQAILLLGEMVLRLIPLSTVGIIDFDNYEKIEQGEEKVIFEIERDITALRYFIF